MCYDSQEDGWLQVELHGFAVLSKSKKEEGLHQQWCLKVAFVSNPQIWARMHSKNIQKKKGE